MSTAGELSATIIVPVFNEEEGVVPFLEGLLKALAAPPEAALEVIVVDDGSTDSTAEKLGDLKGITVLSHKHNRGYGAALKTGIRRSAHDTIVIIDADNSYDPADILKLLPHMEKNDMVVGRRPVVPGGREFMREAAKWVLKKIANFLTKRKIPDLNSGLRVMDRAVVNKFMYLLPDGFSFTTTITMAMMTNHYHVRFEPIHYGARTGSSKIKPVSDFMSFVYLILTTMLCFKPERIFLPLAVLFFAASVFVLFASYLFTEKVMDVTTVLLFVSGFQFMVIGMLAGLIVQLSKRGADDEGPPDKPAQV
ncbi:MAG: glycosyltransferase family 2 protein [Thermodesulfobacteriota bacterium]